MKAILTSQNPTAEEVKFDDGESFQDKLNNGFLKGQDGAAAGFGAPTAEVDSGTGVPSVEVTASGDDTKKVFNFSFHNLKGADGAAGKDGAAGAPGKDGAAGKDGVSPTVTTTAVAGGTKVTITDAAGAKEFTVTNGKDGAAGGKGDKGDAGPNVVSTTTSTAINGLLKGNGETVEEAVAGVDYLTAKSPVIDGDVTIIGTLSIPNSKINMGNSMLGFTGTIVNLSEPKDEHDAANKGYVDALRPTIQKLTLAQSGWGSESTQSVSCPGIVTDETKQVVCVDPAVADFKAYCDAGCYVSGIAADQLTFTCGKTPEKDLTVYVSIQKAG